MKASGVYWTLTDQSFKVTGSTELLGLVFLMTTKGKVGALNEVTSENIEDVIGYDLNYNGNYLGLKNVLEKVPYIQVFRLNHNPARANIFDSGASLSSIPSLHEDEVLESGTTFNISLTDAGKDIGHYVKIQFPSSRMAFDTPALVSDHYVLNFASSIDLSKKCISYGGKKYIGAVYQYDESLLGVMEDGKIYGLEGDEVTDVEIGTYTASSLSLDASFVEPTGPQFLVDAYVSAERLYELVHAVSTDGLTFRKAKKHKFSLLSSSDLYWEKIDFEELTVFFQPGAINTSLLENYVLLPNGDNGTIPTVGQLNLTLLGESGANICVVPGITNVGLVNKIAEKCHTLLKSCFVGVPTFSRFAEAKAWTDSLFNSEYLITPWISDLVETEVGEVFISPAYNLFLIYANMLSSQGSLNYPPAGYSYGNISITKLQKTDYDLHLDELKTNRINYQMVGPRGPVMWEDRTRYGSETDLSYAATTFIMRDLRNRVLTYASSFNFRYTNPTMLTTFGRGLRTIFDNMKDEGFLSAYTLEVPTFAQAQAAGRTLTIKAGVAVMQAANVINFDIVLQNYSDIAA